MHDTIKSLTFCIVAAIAAAVPSYLLIQYWGGFTYRGFVNMDVLFFTMVFAGGLALKRRPFKILIGILCAGGIGLSLLFDIQNLRIQSPTFNDYISALSFGGTFACMIFFLLLISLCLYLAARAKPIKWDIAAITILLIFILHCFVYSIKTSSPIAISPALQKLELYSEMQMKK